MSRWPIIFLCAGWTACGDPTAPISLEDLDPPGLVPDPSWLAFPCIGGSCDEVRTTTIAVRGRRAIAVRRIGLANPDRMDFAVTSDRSPPFVLTIDETLAIDVQHRPNGDPTPDDAELLITYTDADPDGSDPERIDPGVVAVPLVRRRIGEALLTVSPAELNFGLVPLGSERSLPLTIRNEGFGNGGLWLDATATGRFEDLTIERRPPGALFPSEAWDLSVVFRPTEERVFRGVLSLRAVGTETAVMVPVVGTSRPRATLVVTPAGPIDLGELAVGQRAQTILTVSNEGGTPLTVQQTWIEPGTDDVSVRGPGVDAPARIAPLGSAEITVALTASRPGPAQFALHLVTDADEHGVWTTPVRALVVRPQLEITPSTVDFGLVPRGWTVTRPLEIRNAGFGELVVNDVSTTIGSSSLFTLAQRPRFPVTLRHRERVGLELVFRAEAEAVFRAAITISAQGADTEVPLRSEGTSCERGCPVANGTPRCASGRCAIAECDPDYYDTDQRASNGCECASVAPDPGPFCAEAQYIGRLDDDGSSATWVGQIATADDRDLVRFFAYDDSGFFTDAWRVEVRLESADPGIRFCIFRHGTGAHLNACFFVTESCPEDRVYRRDGRFGRDDSADYVVRVFRTPGADATCTPYTLYVRNG